LPFKVEELFDYLGGIENIESIDSSMSKVTFKLKSNEIVAVDKIKDLGVSGIVETKGGFTFIFGSISPEIARVVKEKM
jgi:PTS system D-glucosamine-specific IIC component